MSNHLFVSKCSGLLHSLHLTEPLGGWKRGHRTGRRGMDLTGLHLWLACSATLSREARPSLLRVLLLSVQLLPGGQNLQSQKLSFPSEAGVSAQYPEHGRKQPELVHARHHKGNLACGGHSLWRLRGHTPASGLGLVQWLSGGGGRMTRPGGVPLPSPRLTPGSPLIVIRVTTFQEQQSLTT